MRLQANACGRAFFYACMLVVYVRMGVKMRGADSAFFAGALWRIGCGHGAGREAGLSVRLAEPPPL